MAGKKKLGTPTKGPMLLGGLDLDDIDSLLGDDGSAGSKGKRTPKESVRKLSDAAMRSVRDKVTPRSVLQSFIRTALPDGYTRLIGLYDEVRQGTIAVVDGVEATEYQALEKLTGQFENQLPKLKGKVSDAVYERIRQKIEDRREGYELRRQIEQARQARTNGEYDATAENSTVSNMLEELENASEQNDQAQAASDEEHNKLQYEVRRDTLRARVDKSRHDSLTQYLGVIADSAQRTTSYNDNVGYQFQKKSLELQMRQYLAIRGVVKNTTESLKLQREAFTALVHNTGLPEFRKATEAEVTKWHVKEAMRNPFRQLLNKTATDAASNFLPNLFNNIGSKAAGAVRNAGMSQGGMLSMLLKRVVSDPENTIGGMAGDGLSQAVHRLLIPTMARRAKPLFQKASDKLTGGADSRIAYGLDNMAAIAQKFANDPSQSLGARGKLQGLVRKFAPQFRQDDLVKTGTYQTIGEAASFNQMTQRSIVEIIPGYLSRILQETRMIRTGDDTIGREVYDLTEGKFVQSSKAQKNLGKRILSQGSRRSANWSLNRTTSTMDAAGELSAEAKYALEERLMRDAMEGRHFDPSAYIKGDGYAPTTDGKVVQELEAFFKNKFKFDTSGKLEKDADNYRKRQQYSVEFNSLRDSVRSPVSEIERLLKSGNHTALRELGLIKTVEGEDRIDYGTLRDMYRDLGDTNGPPGSDGAPPVPPGPTSPLLTRVRRGLKEASDRARKGGRRVRRSAEDLAARGGDLRDELLEQGDDLRTKATEEMRKNARRARRKAKSLKETVAEAMPDVNLSDEFDAADIRGMLQNHRLKTNEKLAVARDTISDLRVAGSDMVSVKASELMEGTLIDSATQRVVRQLSDITGEVVDSAGRVRLTAAEVAKGLVTTADNKVHDLLKHLPTQLPSNVLSMLNRQRHTIGNLIRQEDGVMSRVQDLYLEGANDPVIKAAGIRAGEYIDIATQKVLETVDDISGAVARIDRPDEVLFTAQEAAERLVDRTGKRFRSSKLLRGLAALTGRSFNLTAGMMKIGLAVARKTAMVIGKKLNMLDAYLPGPDGTGKPVLLASKLKRGEYYTADGKQLQSFDDIRGDVYTADGNLLVGEDDVAQLVNRDGTKHTAAKRRSFMRRMLKKVMMAPVKGAKALAGAWWKGTKSYYKGMGKMVAKKFGKTTAKADVYNKEWLTPTDGILGNILGVLDKRLPKEEAKEGSWQQKLAEAEAASKDKKAKKVQDKRDKKMAGGGLLAGLKSLLGKKPAKEEDEEESSGLDINIENNGDSDKKSKKRKKVRKPPGRMRRGFDKLAKTKLGRTVGKLGGSALMRGAASIGGRIAGGAALSGLGSLLGGSALGSVAGSAAGLLGGGLGAIGAGAAAAGTALMGILASPVVLGALAVTAVGAGGYWLWNRSKSTSGEFRDLRMLQYGIDSTGDKLKVLELEAYLEPFTSKSNDPQLNIKSADPQKIFEIMDVSADKPEEVMRLATWIDQRFKPVYCTWQRAMFNLTPMGTGINELEDKLPDAAKYDFFSYLKAIPVTVYNELGNPFDEDPLEVKPAAIDAMLTELLDKYRDKAQRKDDPNKTADTLKEGGVAIAPLAASKLKGPAGSAEGKVEEGTWDKLKAGAKNLLPTMGLASGVAALISSAKDTWAGDALKKAGGGAKLLASSGLLGGLALVSSVVTSKAFAGDRLTTLQALRVRAYGKMSLDNKTVGALFEIEELVYKDTKYDTNGQANYQGNLDDLISQAGRIFGVDVGDSRSRKAQEFTSWLLQRFIPVALAYFAGIRTQGQAITPNRVETAFDFVAKLQVGNAILAATYEVNAEQISIWKADTFFNNGTADLGALRAQAEKELSILKESAEWDKLSSPGTSVKDQENQEKDQQKTTAEKIMDSASNLSKSISDSISNFNAGVKDTIGGAFSKAKEFLGLGGGSAKPAAAPSANNSAYATSYTPGGAVQASGSSYSTLAEGNGGQWTTIPLPKSKNREGAMPTLLAVQAMTGVDAELLATFASMESNFDYSVKAATSSATGWFQFINTTWDGMLAAHASKYGIPPDNGDRYLRKDPRINALMGAEFLKGNYKILAKALGRAPSDTDLYFAHFLGPVTAAGFLKRDQNAPAASLYPQQASANRSIFYKPTGQARTIGEVYQVFDNKVRKHRKGGGGASVTKAPTDGGAGQAAIDQKAQSAAMTADMKPADQGVNGAVGINPQSVNPNDSLAMAADRTAAPMRMGDPSKTGVAPTDSAAPTDAPAATGTAATTPPVGGSSDNSPVVSSGQTLEQRKLALAEEATRAQAADRAATVTNQKRQVAEAASQTVLTDQLTTQQEMRDLLKTIAQRLNTPASAPAAPTVPQAPQAAPGNDMGKSNAQNERRGGNAPAPLSFAR